VAEQGQRHKDDVFLEAALDEWERFYNFANPHDAFNGKTLRFTANKQDV